MEKKNEITKRKKRRNLSLLIFLIFLLISLGWIINEKILKRDYKPFYQGFWLQNFNENEANEYVYGKEENGDWVCVNIRGMEYERAIEVIAHEVGHEIFAELCEKNPMKCFSIEKENKTLI